MCNPTSFPEPSPVTIELSALTKRYAQGSAPLSALDNVAFNLKVQGVDKAELHRHAGDHATLPVHPDTGRADELAKILDGIWFGHTESLPARVKLAFRLDADEWQGIKRVRFLVEAAEI